MLHSYARRVSVAWSQSVRDSDTVSILPSVCVMYDLDRNTSLHGEILFLTFRLS